MLQFNINLTECPKYKTRKNVTGIKNILRIFQEFLKDMNSKLKKQNKYWEWEKQINLLI